MIEGKGEPNSIKGWLSGARRMATVDLLQQLTRMPAFSSLLLVSPDPTDILSHCQTVTYVPSPSNNFHFGEQLSQLVQKFAPKQIVYFGGGSAPLLTDDILHTIVQQLTQSSQLVVANNRFSTDWAGIVPANQLIPFADRLPRDNMLGWVLGEEAGYPIIALPATSATRLDIDTPTDLLTLSLHPHTKLFLKRFLAGLPLNLTDYETALQLLKTPATRLFIAGRLAPNVWQRLNQLTQCWIRVLAEERGMVSSGREERGEVYSLLAEWLEQVGVEPFFAGIHQWADLAFIDSRVLMAHHQLKVPASDRFASDLGLLTQIQSPWLHAFTEAVQHAKIPILLGGHSLLAGNLLAFCDLLQSSSPS